MTTLQIDEKTAWDIYPGTTKEMQAILEKSFPKGFFSRKITDRIKSVEDACAICPPSENVKTLLAYNGIDKDMIGAQAMAKLSIIARALNEGWTPDWKDGNQYKYYPYFKQNGAGFGFSFTFCADWHSVARCGSRLCFKSSELAMYAGKQFEAIYNDFLNNQ